MIPQGIGVALITPFTRDGEIDVASLEKLTDKLCQEADFLAPLGTTAETPTLTEEECDKILDTVFSVNAGRLPVVVGCGGNNTAAVIRKIVYLERKYRPNAFFSVSPYYNKPSQTGIERHYLEIASRINTPLILYDVPARTGRPIAPETTAKLAKSASNIVGLKDASGSMEHANALCLLLDTSSFTLISGDDKFAFLHKKLGYKAVISVAANAAAPLMKRLWTAAESSNLYQTFRDDYQHFLEFSDLIFEQGSPSGIKHALKAMGMCESNVRMPLSEISPELGVRIENVLGKMRV
ncbi:MAG: 4-hydroxy-tetrahydrodipicolinate synthase [Bacteroidia bacterium]|nr:4-hydroxy-tetrahydrodipicolinate synthase [Bacteroidia bacterium]MDW8332917.1 4-hydroxy-tetrahydrodipicolinate synthase [Bacteroidia bacterium]